MSVTRRTFLRTAALAAGVTATACPLRAQPRTIKVGAVFPVTGAMAEVGQDCRAGAQLAIDAINATGGIKAMGGTRMELITGDSQTRVEVARAEAERLINGGAQILTGAFHSAHIATIAPLAQQRRVPYVIDITATDSITANIAKSVREGQQKTQYVYRIFPSSGTFTRNAVRYMTEIFRAANVSPRRVVVMYTNDLFGKNQSAGFEAAVKADEAQIESARVQLGYTQITAPFSGRIGLRQVDLGNILRATDQVGGALLRMARGRRAGGRHAERVHPAGEQGRGGGRSRGRRDQGARDERERDECEVASGRILLPL